MARIRFASKASASASLARSLILTAVMEMGIGTIEWQLIETSRRTPPANKKARISNAPKSASTLMRQASRTQIAEDEIVPESWKAPVAKMW